MANPTGTDGGRQQPATDRPSQGARVTPLSSVQSSVSGAPNTEPVASSRRHPVIYLWPNLLTTVVLFAGFWAVLQSAGGRHEYAAIAVLIAMLFDGLDGRVARRINAQSTFGLHYDSFADMVSFGVAPPLIAYHWGLYALGSAGQAIAFFYAACTAMRLSRFNSSASEHTPRHFQGLSSPMAALLLSALVWGMCDIGYGTGGGETPLALAWLVAAVAVMAGVLMLLDLPYRSFKDAKSRRRVSFPVTVTVLLLLVAVAINPPWMLWLVAVLYALSGPLAWLWRQRRANAPPADSGH